MTCLAQEIHVAWFDVIVNALPCQHYFHPETYPSQLRLGRFPTGSRWTPSRRFSIHQPVGKRPSIPSDCITVNEFVIARLWNRSIHRMSPVPPMFQWISFPTALNGLSLCSCKWKSNKWLIREFFSPIPFFFCFGRFFKVHLFTK
jgi:hypothetical protein